MTAELLGCVLAGGRSTRMGQDKADLLLQGQTLLQRAIELLHTAGADRVVVSGRPEVPGAIPDLLPQCGPPGGLYSILEHLKLSHGLESTVLLFIPVDMPLLKVATLRAVVDGCADDAACHFAGEVFPCAIKASPRLLAHLQELFLEDTQLGGKRSMKGIFEWLHANSLPLPAFMLREFMNVNTPADWEAIQLEYRTPAV